MSSKQWQKGYDAYFEGWSEFDCPYDELTKNSKRNKKCWIGGYYSAIEKDNELRDYLDAH